MLSTEPIDVTILPPDEGPEDCITTSDASLQLCVTEDRLRKWRRTGEGPAFIYIAPGFIRYRKADIEAWLSRNRHMAMPRKTASGATSYA